MKRYELLLYLLLGIAIGAIGVSILRDVQSEPLTHSCVESKTREEIRVLTLEGINQALKSHVQNLFEIWIKDQHDQPRRAIVGMTNGISAYLRARANAMQWNPTICPEEGK